MDFFKQEPRQISHSSRNDSEFVIDVSVYRIAINRTSMTEKRYSLAKIGLHQIGLSCFTGMALIAWSSYPGSPNGYILVLSGALAILSGFVISLMSLDTATLPNRKDALAHLSDPIMKLAYHLSRFDKSLLGLLDIYNHVVEGKTLGLLRVDPDSLHKLSVGLNRMVEASKRAGAIYDWHKKDRTIRSASMPELPSLAIDFAEIQEVISELRSIAVENGTSGVLDELVRKEEALAELELELSGLLPGRA